MTDISKIRKDYSGAKLSQSSVDRDPIKQFDIWLRNAIDAKLPEPTAMVLSTGNAQGFISSRTVLLKGITDNHFVFYTNYNSRKGKAIESNKKACLHFFWPTLERQIIIKADLERLPENLSDGYFHSRPKGSQLGAVVSPQSEVIPDRDFLENKLKISV